MAQRSNKSIFSVFLMRFPLTRFLSASLEMQERIAMFLVDFFSGSILSINIETLFAKGSRDYHLWISDRFSRRNSFKIYRCWLQHWVNGQSLYHVRAARRRMHSSRLIFVEYLSHFHLMVHLSAFCWKWCEYKYMQSKSFHVQVHHLIYHDFIMQLIIAKNLTIITQSSCVCHLYTLHSIFSLRKAIWL